MVVEAERGSRSCFARGLCRSQLREVGLVLVAKRLVGVRVLIARASGMVWVVIVGRLAGVQGVR